MTNTTSTNAGRFDTGPLSWVIGEVRDALARSGAALRDAAARSSEAQPTLLLHAKTHLHQAHGALQLVDVDGVGMLTRAAEEALERFKEGQLPASGEHAQVLQDAYRALTEYLEELVAGAPQQPARLFPYHRALQELLGAERIHPSDLLCVEPGVPAGLPPAPATADPDYAACRARFEKALLPYLKSQDAQDQRGHARALREAIAPVADGQHEPDARAFWLAMHAFAGLVADGQLESDLYVKQLFGQINLQVRRLAQGQGSCPEPMLRDALFFIAAAPAPDEQAQLLRRAWRLDGLVPPDYATRRYGRIDAAALREAKEALARTKADWDRLAVQADAHLEDDFNQALSRLASASEKLGAPALAQLLRELGRAARESIASSRTEQFGLEMATAMLFVENGLDQLRHLPDDFAEHAEAVGARLLALAAGETPPDAPHWQGELARQIQQGQTVAVLAGEIKAALRQVEKLLDEYYDRPDRRGALVQAGPVLHQLQGALSILDQDQAALAARHVGDAVRRLADDDGDLERQAAALHNIAQNIGALGFFSDLLARNDDAAKARFTFDEEKQLLRELPFEQAAHDSADPLDAKAPPPHVAAAEGDAAIEAELLEIFVTEAQEVLAAVAATLPAAHAEPASQETLTLLRRSFHTLKGSGRMVGLERFADAAAAIERVMNLWLAEARPADADLLALAGAAHAQLSAWVGELVAAGTSTRDGAALVAAAERVREGGTFVLEGPAEERADAPAAPAGQMLVADETGFGELLPANEEVRADEPAPVAEVIEALPAPEDEEPQMQAGPAPVAQTEPAPVLGNLGEPPGTDAGTRRVGELEIARALYDIYLAETDELLRTLVREAEEWRREPLRPVSPEALKAAHTLAGTSATVGFAALRDLAGALEGVLEKLAVAAPPALEEAQRDLPGAVLERVGAMLQAFALGELAPPQADLLEQLEALRTQLSSHQASLVHGDAGPDLAQRLDALFTAAYDSLLGKPQPETDGAGSDGPAAQAPSTESAGSDAAPEPQFDDDLLAAPVLDQAAPGAASAGGPNPAQAGAQHRPAQAALPGDTALPAEPVFNDELDPDLLPVFLEEGADLFPQIGNGLRQWQNNPADSAVAQGLMRALHTVKGSARMAGAMRLGQHTHELETQIENMLHAGTTGQGAFDELLAGYDQALLLFEQLQQPRDAAPAQPATEQALEPAVRAPLVRVRADILDRLVNQAGEVSISRSRIENQVGTLKAALSELSDDLGRLRRQLREVEMQAESQIASRLSIAGEREFDPLEFDRFTRLQELTRMMAESVDDVASFHESLARTVDNTGEDLAAQSRMTRELQRDLMRVRMVPFASLAERLYRVARQTAKETDKRVNLDIRGSAVEIDRSVLEQMAAPFEHLLRNAIVHGIEPRAARAAAGKPETGELLVQVSQQGNEVAIQFSDDGAGLDLARIRAKARTRGLLAQDEEVADADAAELIFEPGFSTADSLTELAGRGIGMDVVRSEAQALGGRVAIDSAPGRGARFSIHLPLTLAVAQVVLVAAGGTVHALPSTLVEQVMQVREGELAAAREAGALAVHGEPAPLHYLPALLGEGAQPAQQRSSPVVVLNGGSGRIALLVDEVVGNREVVIKNAGPQLARLPGIAGATVLGSGDIVLILNAVVLAQQASQRPLPTGSAVAQPPQLATIMVVDDSLTVRRVTQRLLEREGYQVMLARDGVDALEQLRQSRPDLMLVDIEMPRMDGFDLTRHVRGMEETAAIPIIMITSRAADKHRNYALELGVNAYFGKPYQEPVLLAAIEGLLGS
jgi:chemosensory pili system protein ChpA (sensor histidine kinase/response regulator)